MKPAAIVLFTYKRLDTLKKCLASLTLCQLSAESELIVFSDAPKSDLDIEKVSIVRSYLKTVSHFKKITVNERPGNLGADYNIINGLKEVSAYCEKFIIIEDDLVFSENFLLFMNQALSKYQDYPEVLSVSGFSFIDSISPNYSYDGYFARRSWSWGWGSWGSKMRKVDWDVTDFADFMKDKSRQSLFNKTGGSDLTRMLQKTMAGKLRAWDVRLFYYQFKQNLVTVYPVSTKTANIGFSKEGSHTFGYNRYKTPMDTSGKKNFNLPEKALIDERINAAYLRKNNIMNRVITRLFSMIGIK